MLLSIRCQTSAFYFFKNMLFSKVFFMLKFLKNYNKNLNKMLKSGYILMSIQLEQ